MELQCVLENDERLQYVLAICKANAIPSALVLVNDKTLFVTKGRWHNLFQEDNIQQVYEANNIYCCEISPNSNFIAKHTPEHACRKSLASVRLLGRLHELFILPMAAMRSDCEYNLPLAINIKWMESQSERCKPCPSSPPLHPVYLIIKWQEWIVYSDIKKKSYS